MSNDAMKSFIEGMNSASAAATAQSRPVKGKVSSKDVLDSLAMTAKTGDAYLCDVDGEERRYVFDGKKFVAED